MSVSRQLRRSPWLPKSPRLTSYLDRAVSKVVAKAVVVVDLAAAKVAVEVSSSRRKVHTM